MPAVRARASRLLRADNPGWTDLASSRMPSSDMGAAQPGYRLPLTRTVPLVGRSRPSITRMVVDFPAPFGPRNPVTTPGSTTKLSRSTAVLSP